jgi:hypothetical protein
MMSQISLGLYDHHLPWDRHHLLQSRFLFQSTAVKSQPFLIKWKAVKFIDSVSCDLTTSFYFIMWDTAEIEIFPVVVLFLVLASCHVLCARQG